MQALTFITEKGGRGAFKNRRQKKKGSGLKKAKREDFFSRIIQSIEDKKRKVA